MNLRQVLSGTDQLRQQLLQAVDRLDNDFQQTPGTNASVNHQQRPPSATSTTTSTQPVFVPATTQFVSRTVAVQPAIIRSTMPPYSQSPTQQLSASATQQSASSYPRSLLPSTTLQSASSYPRSLPPYPQSNTQQPASSYPRSLLPSATQRPSCSYTPMSQSSTPVNLDSLLQQQTSSLFCTDPRRQTFLWNPRSSIGMK